jgi:hypothetical protein
MIDTKDKDKLDIATWTWFFAINILGFFGLSAIYYKFSAKFKEDFVYFANKNIKISPLTNFCLNYYGWVLLFLALVILALLFVNKKFNSKRLCVVSIFSMMLLYGIAGALYVNGVFLQIFQIAAQVK